MRLAEGSSTAQANDDRGRIDVVMDSHTGEMIQSKFIPPKKKTEANAA